MLSSNAIYNFFYCCIYSPQPYSEERSPSQQKGQNPSCLNHYSESIPDSRSFSSSPSENLSPSFSTGPQDSDSSTHKTHVIWKNFKDLIENPLPLLGLLLLGNVFIHTNSSYPRLNMLIQKVTDCALLFLGFLIVGFLFPSDQSETQKPLTPEIVSKKPPATFSSLRTLVQSPPGLGRSSSASSSTYQQPPIESISQTLQEEDIAPFLEKVKHYILPYLNISLDVSYRGDFYMLFESEWDDQIAFAPSQLPLDTIQDQVEALTFTIMRNNQLSSSPIPMSWEELSFSILEKMLFVTVLKNVIQKSSEKEALFNWIKEIFDRVCSSSLESTKDRLMLDLLSKNKNYLLGSDLELYDKYDSIQDFEIFLFS